MSLPSDKRSGSVRLLHGNDVAPFENVVDTDGPALLVPFNGAALTAGITRMELSYSAAPRLEEAELRTRGIGFGHLWLPEKGRWFVNILTPGFVGDSDVPFEELHEPESLSVQDFFFGGKPRVAEQAVFQLNQVSSTVILPFSDSLDCLAFHVTRAGGGDVFLHWGGQPVTQSVYLRAGTSNYVFEQRTLPYAQLEGRTVSGLVACGVTMYKR